MAKKLAPEEGLVIGYSYLWLTEHRIGLEEGLKDRPCAIVLMVADGGDGSLVSVLPLTHSPPARHEDGIEIPPATKRRLGLDERRSWIVLTETNEFRWPGPDLRPVRRFGPRSFTYGFLPYTLFERVRQGFMKATLDRRAARVTRTE